ncbi:MAG: hypothetical protein QXL51_00250 [Candidatus Aenigmatarchaeota archaeon]
MKLRNNFYWFSILGDEKEHDFNEILYFRWILTHRREKLKNLLKEFKILLEYGLIERRPDTLIYPLNQSYFKLSSKGKSYFNEIKEYFKGWR